MIKESTILEMFDQVEMEKTTSKEYKKLLHRYCDLREKFETKLNEEEKKELDEFITIFEDMGTMEMREFFIDGFTKAVKIMTEVFYKQSDNE